MTARYTRAMRTLHWLVVLTDFAGMKRTALLFAQARCKLARKRTGRMG